MKYLNIELPDDFLQGEERCGYYVSPEMKEVWAIELDLLSQFMNVCHKYGIQYYAGGGTMLGAVRHKGFIPWDDDIDIFMKRSEYERFVRIAKSGVFQAPYFWQDHITDPGYLGDPGRLQNCNTTAMGLGYMDEKNGIVTQHLGVFLDVFPLDNIPDSEEERKSWKFGISKVARKAWNLSMYRNRGLLHDDKDLEWLDFWLKLTNQPNALFEKYYALLADNAEEATEKCCIYSFFCRNIGHWVFNNSDWEGEVLMPFEMLQVPVPAGYENILKDTYGDWQTPVRGASVHETLNKGLFFDTKHPYTDYVDPITGINKDLVRSLVK